VVRRGIVSTRTSQNDLYIRMHRRIAQGAWHGGVTASLKLEFILSGRAIDISQQKTWLVFAASVVSEARSRRSIGENPHPKRNKAK
jgi:hypothetical protein